MEASESDGPLSLEEIERLQTAFARLDTDGQGTLSIYELRRLFSSIGEDLSQAEVQRIFREMDVDEDNTISFDEFKAMVAAKRREATLHGSEDLLARMMLGDDDVKQMREIFQMFDRENRGCISAANITALLTQLTGTSMSVEDMRDLVAEVDVDGDGQITFDEFLSMMAKKARDVHSQEGLADVFGILDKQNTGNLSLADLERVYAIVGENASAADLELVLRSADVDGDGMVTLKDVRAVMVGVRTASSLSGRSSALNRSNSEASLGTRTDG